MSFFEKLDPIAMVEDINRLKETQKVYAWYKYKFGGITADLLKENYTDEFLFLKVTSDHTLEGIDPFARSLIMEYLFKDKTIESLKLDDKYKYIDVEQVLEDSLNLFCFTNLFFIDMNDREFYRFMI